jgi:hypothetical protein
MQYNIYTVDPRFTNAPVHEQFGSRTNFPRKTPLMRTVSRITNTQAGNSGKLAIATSWEYRCGSVNCWLTNLVSVYEYFGSRTASRNGLISWTEVPLCIYIYIWCNTSVCTWVHRVHREMFIFIEWFPPICRNAKQYTSALVMRYWYCVNYFIITWLTQVIEAKNSYCFEQSYCTVCLSAVFGINSSCHFPDLFRYCNPLSALLQCPNWQGISTSLSELAGYVHFSVRVSRICPASVVVIVRVGKCIKQRMEILTIVDCNNGSVCYLMSSEIERNLTQLL